MQFRPLIRHTSLPLAASLFMNVMLAGTLMVLWQTKQEPMVLPAPAARPVSAAAKAKPEVPKAAVAAVAPAPFHWRQLDAPDFPTFVNNLRGIGCPEATIRDIIQCELNEVYAVKRQEMERELAVAPHSSRAALKTRLAQLNMEATGVLSTALSGGTSTTAASEPGAGMTQAGPAVAANAKPSASTMTPAAFLVGNDPSQPTAAGTLTAAPTDTSMNAVTMAVITQMRGDFANALQEVSADPSSQVYRQRWLTAQRASDEQFSSMFGGDNFIKTQTEAVRAAADVKH